MYTVIRILYLQYTNHNRIVFFEYLYTPCRFKKMVCFMYTFQITNNVKSCSLNACRLSDRKKRKDVFAWLRQKKK